MYTREPELAPLRPRLGDARTDLLLARERREVFSIHPELRIAGWLGAVLLASAAGVFLKNNLERIGPLALAILIGIAALGCYAWTWVRRKRASAVDDYVLLLGALLVSADVAFIQAQFHVFHDLLKRELLLLAVLHAIGAYAFGSRVLLSLAITAFGGYLGFDRTRMFEDAAMPAFALSAILVAWRAVDRAARPRTTFSRTFEHFAANAALLGGLLVMDDSRFFSVILTVGIAAAVVMWGFHTRHEPFVLYAFVYAVLAVMIFILDEGGAGTAFVILAALIAAVAGLLYLHSEFKERR